MWLYLDLVEGSFVEIAFLFFFWSGGRVGNVNVVVVSMESSRSFFVPSSTYTVDGWMDGWMDGVYSFRSFFYTGWMDGWMESTHFLLSFFYVYSGCMHSTHFVPSSTYTVDGWSIVVHYSFFYVYTGCMISSLLLRIH